MLDRLPPELVLQILAQYPPSYSSPIDLEDYRHALLRVSLVCRRIRAIAQELLAEIVQARFFVGEECAELKRAVNDTQTVGDRVRTLMLQPYGGKLRALPGEQLVGCSRLSELALHSCKVDLAVLARIPNLKRLVLDTCHVQLATDAANTLCYPRLREYSASHVSYESHVPTVLGRRRTFPSLTAFASDSTNSVDDNLFQAWHRDLDAVVLSRYTLERYYQEEVQAAQSSTLVNLYLDDPDLGTPLRFLPANIRIMFFSHEYDEDEAPNWAAEPLLRSILPSLWRACTPSYPLRTLILPYELQDVFEWEYGDEYDRVVRAQCEKWGTTLLWASGFTTTFETIISPSFVYYRRVQKQRKVEAVLAALRV
ncbi:hypothetical protein JCM10207_001047 [Rhodosporidiobolus poonsookiae]